MKLFFLRLRGILRKETLQILRDPSSIILALVMPLVLLVIFTYGISFDAQHIPLALVNKDPGALSRDLAARFSLSSAFDVYPVRSMEQAESLLRIRAADGIITLHNDFTARLNGGAPDGAVQAPVQLILNGIDANRARLIEGYVRSVVGSWTQMRLARSENAAVPPVSIAHRIWFNESAESRVFMVPGLITLIMTLIGILLTALVIAREWERGTMEAILVTPLRKIEILLGKIIPYYVLGMMGMCLSVTVARFVFGVSCRASIGTLFLLSSVFMLACLGFGLLLSASFRLQFVAAMISIVSGFLPAFFLSGLIFDLESTPMLIQFVSYIVPARYYVSISHTLFMAGEIWPILLPDAVVLALMALFFLGISYRKISKRLE